MPDGDGPFPLVLNPVGHWGDAKNEETPAARNRGLAKLGYIAITYDPFGQGERNVPGNNHQEAWRLALTGRTNMPIMVHDTIRALDYMLTRSDVDGGFVAISSCPGPKSGEERIERIELTPLGRCNRVHEANRKARMTRVDSAAL